MRLRYIGQNGSMGMNFGRIYRLKIEPWRDGVLVTSGGFRCPYASDELFWQNWAHPREDMQAIFEAKGKAMRELYFAREFELAPMQECTREEIHGSHNWGDPSAEVPVYWCPGRTTKKEQ